jgi:hypothetical protein
MALKFEPEEVVYDPGDGLLRFFATENLMPIQCAITLWALMALEEAALAGPDRKVSHATFQSDVLRPRLVGLPRAPHCRSAQREGSCGEGLWGPPD